MLDRLLQKPQRRFPLQQARYYRQLAVVVAQTFA
jgi:hypothetical protein